MATVLPRRHGPRVSLLDMVYGNAKAPRAKPEPVEPAAVAVPVKGKAAAKKTAKPARAKAGKPKRK